MLGVRELPDDVHAEITRLSREGDEAAAAGRFDDAIGKYESAFALVPESKWDWDASTWILVAIADAHFHAGRFVESRAPLQEVMHCPGAIGNPFVHLRRGQVFYELGEEESAADELARAFLSVGRGLFRDDDPKYLDFLLTKLRPPEGFATWEEYFRKTEKPWWKFW